MNKKKAPFAHIVKRQAISWKSVWMIRALAIAAAIATCALVTFLLTGDDPISIFKTIWEGSFASERRMWVLLQNVSILLIISLAMAPAFRMRFWNIGGEGQVMISVLATSSCMIMLGGKIPNALLIVIEIVAAVAAGAVWAAIPAFFKSRWNTNETLFTLMMNYVATQLVAYFIIIWESPRGSGKIGIINQSTHRFSFGFSLNLPLISSLFILSLYYSSISCFHCSIIVSMLNLVANYQTQDHLNIGSKNALKMINTDCVFVPKNFELGSGATGDMYSKNIVSLVNMYQQFFILGKFIDINLLNAV